jgi:hypothetical protein
MSQRANLIKCHGLVTNGSELSTPEGSLRKATNVNVDEDGVITPRRGLNDFGGATGGTESTANTIKQIIEYKNRIIRYYADKFEFEDENSDFQPVSGSFQEVLQNYRIKWEESNGNMYITTAEGIKKISLKNNSGMSSTSTLNITDAGGIKGSDLFAVTVPATGGGFLPPQSKVAYRILFGTKDENNNLILGSPSARYVVTNYSDDVKVLEASSVKIDNAAGIANGDYFLLNTLELKYTVYFEVSGTATPPKKADTIGTTYIKIQTGGSTANDVVAAILANDLAANIPEITTEIDIGDNTKVIITNSEEGDIQDISEASGGTPNITVTKTNDGSVTVGNSANVEVTLTVPNNITTSYFYQIYRTAYIESVEGLELTDLDPGDEMNLVYESSILDSDITNGEISFVDNVPESFRASSAPLYTNQVTGQGILQSNEPPPISLDMELFRNSMFYANTKSRHRLQFNILSIDDFVSGSTRFIVGNEDTTRYYTFVGVAEDTTITAGTFADTANSSYILLNSSNNERKFYLWFDKDGTGTNPEIEGRLGYRVSLTTGMTQQEIVDAIYDALNDNFDFLIETVTNPFDTGSTVAANQIRILHANNGSVDDITTITNTPATDIGTGWSISVTTQGSGEDFDTEAGGDVLLSGLISVAQSIDETARSLVKTINRDSNSPVNAYYLSGSTDLPGIILLENKTLEDKQFYISIDEPANTSIGLEFSPEVPFSKPMERLQGTGPATKITLTGHGYSTGDEVFVSFLPDALDLDAPAEISGIFTITVVDANSFTIPVANLVTIDSDDMTNGFLVDNSAIFTADLESDNLESQNRLYFSKVNEPEAVPIVNYIDVGGKDAEIWRILALRDNLFVLKEDGVFIVSGTSAPNFSVRLLDNTRIIAPDTARVLNNQIYCLTEQGIVTITDSGVGIISGGIENLIDAFANHRVDYKLLSFGIAYENDRAYIMFAPTKTTDTYATQAFRYNIFERTWTRWEIDANCGYVATRDDRLYLGSSTRNYLMQERKNSNRTDHADREFTRTISEGTVVENKMVISSLTDVKTSDVITQTQLVTITYVNNRLLNKMDKFDSGIVPPISSTMYDSFKVSAGDDIAEKLQNLNDYLVTLDAVNITAKVFNSTNYRTLTETLVDELNFPDTITSIKSYKKPETVVYEAYITEVDVQTNEITVHTARPFLEGEIMVYKHFDKEIEWNPQHFGDPSALKQVREISIMFDQNNFNDAIAKYASDVAQDFEEVPFKGKGIGYFGDMPWSDPNHFWGGDGNDIPFRDIVPRTKQRCRYLSLAFVHENAREYFRILGISGVVRAVSSRAYK